LSPWPLGTALRAVCRCRRCGRSRLQGDRRASAQRRRTQEASATGSETWKRKPAAEAVLRARRPDNKPTFESEASEPGPCMKKRNRSSNSFRNMIESVLRRRCQPQACCLPTMMHLRAGLGKSLPGRLPLLTVAITGGRRPLALGLICHSANFSPPLARPDAA
jgi:hypothetical protein